MEGLGEVKVAGKITVLVWLDLPGPADEGALMESSAQALVEPTVVAKVKPDQE